MQIMSDKLCKSEENLRNDTDASIRQSMQTLSERICKSEENLKNELTSATNSSTKVLEVKFSKLLEYIETLERKIESQGRTPDTDKQPSGHGALDTSFTSVQKTQVNPHPAPVESYSQNHSSMKDAMGSPPQNKVIDKNNAETVISEEAITKGNTEEKDAPAKNEPKINDKLKGVKGWKTSSFGVNSSVHKRKKRGNGCQEQAIKLQQLKNEKARIKQWSTM